MKFDQEEVKKEKFNIPFIPKSIDNVDDHVRNIYIRKFVTKIQTPKKNDPDYDRETLIKAAKAGFELERCIFEWSNKDNERKSKFE